MRIQKTTKHCLNDEQRLLMLKRFLNLFSDNLFLRHTGFWKYLTWRFPPWLEPFSFVLCTLYYLWTSYFSFIPFFNNMRWRNTVVSFGAQGSKPFNKRHPPIHLLPPIGNSLFQALTCVMENFWLLWQNDPWFWWRISGFNRGMMEKAEKARTLDTQPPSRVFSFSIEVEAFLKSLSIYFKSHLSQKTWPICTVKWRMYVWNSWLVFLIDMWMVIKFCVVLIFVIETINISYSKSHFQVKWYTSLKKKYFFDFLVWQIISLSNRSFVYPFQCLSFFCWPFFMAN